MKCYNAGLQIIRSKSTVYETFVSVNIINGFLRKFIVNTLWALIDQEGHAVAGNHHGMRGTCTESFHLILGQRSE